MSSLRLRIALGVGRLVGWMSRLFGRGGTALPGLVAMRLDPRLIEKLASSIAGGIVVVTGTNGKTTTTKMITTMLEGGGRSVLTNRSGSNLARGLATVLLRAARRGRIDSDVAVFEIDEAAVATLAERLAPGIIVVTNLARDQLDRYGELVTTAGHVAAAVGVADLAVLNADDPMVAGLDRGRSAWFGAVDDIRRALPPDAGLYSEGDSGPIRDHDARVVRSEASGGSQVVAFEIDGAPVEAHLRVPGVYNAYNAAAALLAVSRLGLDAVDAATDLALMEPPFGRGQVIEFRQRRVATLLVKNPAGLNQVIGLLREASPDTAVLVAINDLIADGRDVSWLWDARVEDLAQTGHRFGAGGFRAADMALRFKYAGIDSWAEVDDRTALNRLVDAAEPGDLVYLVPTYTAMLSFLDLLLPGVSRSEAWR
jgi:UDP-N-acetylmuramyl tripeptide synthase